MELGTLVPLVDLPTRATLHSSHHKSFEKNRGLFVPFVISFSDEDNGSDREERKQPNALVAKGDLNGSNANPGLSTGVGCYILGQLDQQLIGSYTVSELQAPITSNEEDEFEKCQKKAREAEVEALSNINDNERPTTPPEGEEYFTDDDGAKYKWNRNLKAWVPQRHPSSVNSAKIFLVLSHNSFRAQIDVKLHDSTGSLSASAMGETVENILQCRAEVLMDKTATETAPNLSVIVRAQIDKDHAFYVKAILLLPNPTEFSSVVKK
ncbi:unnamed protein product [Fraxinus pennsylvanica]|uniref:Uncharacterized protein n=1 Tax=Fraxinus pennsylvanica TaxID=56036 RepID=A0AAD1YNS2_9LAMI|nr:unnamed protein product [Fraxinus pennsylvanica]